MVYKLNRSLTALFPACCQLCGTASATGLCLCQPCRNEAPWLANVCARCSLPLAASRDDSLCGRCQKQAPMFDATTALFHYRPPVDYLIKRLKFSSELAIVPLLSGLLANRLASRDASLPELLLPVPLHRSRLQERGFNQATELARAVAGLLEIRTTHRLCRRNRKTEPQSLLTHNARRLNLRNAFTVNSDRMPGHVAIIDDVMTTGHTANELARALKGAGVRRVEVWVIARAGG
ncbi:MAG: ComF family protein [Gammaproteobacteria bacterium]|nr:ComF family protein [Gammaproteobacteria bacterium]